MCQILGVSSSGYYQWLKRTPSSLDQRREELLEVIKQIHQQVQGRYGSPRMTAELNARGYPCSVNMIAELMKAHNIRAKRPKRFVRTTDSGHGLTVVENLLDRDFSPLSRDQCWAGDITYIPTEDGWLYLAMIEDLFSRKIVGWSMSDSLESRLVVDALGMALLRRLPEEGLLAHSDRGSQYASDHYRPVLSNHGIECSMSGVAQCWDNAPVESFFASLKKELVHEEKFRTRAEARASIFEYIEVFYNRVRLHSTLGYLSPEQFERTHNQKNP